MIDENLKSIVSTTLKSNADFLNNISQDIWKNPELKFEEKHAHDLLTKALEDKGFSVVKNYVSPTAFRAEYTSKSKCSNIKVMCGFEKKNS